MFTVVFHTHTLITIYHLFWNWKLPAGRCQCADVSVVVFVFVFVFVFDWFLCLELARTLPVCRWHARRLKFLHLSANPWDCMFSSAQSTLAGHNSTWGRPYLLRQRKKFKRQNWKKSTYILDFDNFILHHRWPYITRIGLSKSHFPVES